jgi:hypothetical protein
MDTFERRFEDRVRAFGNAGVRPVDSAALARAVAIGDPRSVRARTAVRWLGFTFDRRAWAVVLALGLLVILLGGALLVGGSLAPSTLLDTRIPVRPSQGQPAVPGPSTTPTAMSSPSPTAAFIVWSPASVAEDWPAPVRREPAGGAAIVHSLAIDRNGPPVKYADPAGDVDASVPWIDIRELWISGSRTTLIMGLAVNVAPVVDPTEQWIAYGVVWDTDRDGVADLRFGGDNPEPTDGRRVWITELHSGRTVVNPGGGYFHETFYDKFFEVFLPSENWGGARLKFGGDTTGTGPNGGGIVGGMHSPFYAWAAVIQDGRVVATDYAPDIGWLDPSAKAKP